MAEAMRGATRVCFKKFCDFIDLQLVSSQAMGAMNRGLNLPQIQRIMNEFEKESATMDMKEEMMSDAVDDVMDDDLEEEEEEGDKILKEVLDEIGVNLSQQVSQSLPCPFCLPLTSLSAAYGRTHRNRCSLNPSR